MIYLQEQNLIIEKRDIQNLKPCVISFYILEELYVMKEQADLIKELEGMVASKKVFNEEDLDLGLEKGLGEKELEDSSKDSKSLLEELNSEVEELNRVKLEEKRKVLGKEIDSLSKEEIVDKKVIREIFNVFSGSNSEEFNNVLERVLNRAREFNVETETRNHVLYFLNKKNKKDEELEERSNRLKWHMEVKKRRDEEHERKILKQKERDRDAAYEELERLEIKKKRLEEYAQMKSEFRDALNEEFAEEIVEKKFVYKQNGELDGKSIINYDLVIQNDKYINEHLKFNEFSNNLEFDGKNFTNGDLLNLYSYIDRLYGLRDANLIWNALNRPGNVKSYHPIKDIIEFKKWDGISRIDDFFRIVCNVNITDDKMEAYYREVARMLFFGGISRLYEPGCKFDYMIILRGEQGTCKTTLARLLALDDAAYSEVTSIDGSVGIEAIQGAWICEFAELLAMVRAREVESIKAFITRQYDKYRAPYARVTETIPRSCIFIGTTNEAQFMGDMTGNRRYLPVEVHTNATEFFENIEEKKKYILACWREAFYKYMTGDIYTTISPEYFDLLEEVRERYVEDNPVEGLIRGYLDSLPVGTEVCSLEIFIKALNGNRNKFTTRDSRAIATTLNKCRNWVRSNERKYFSEDGYGRQRYWKKVGE